MKRMLQVAVATLSIAYPFLIYWGLKLYDARVLVPLLLILLGLRWISSNKATERNIALASIVAVIVVSLAWDFTLSLKFYPVVINLGFLVVFVSSLISPPTIIERFARIQNPELSPKAIAYTRKVTWVWSMFFIVNGSIATFTALLASNEVWALYNGFIAYLLIATLFAGEWLVRRRVLSA